MEVSVIIPTYNRARLLRGAIDSVLEQVDHRGGVEIVVVDDGSTDGTDELLRSYGSEIRAVRCENGGPARARNLGANLVRGEWLAFLDSDDRWLPSKLALQLERAGPDDALIYTDRFDQFGAGSWRRFSDRASLLEGMVLPRLLARNFITLSSVLMRRRRFLELGGFPDEIHGAEDWDLWLRHAESSPVALCDEPLVVYRVDGHGVSSDPCVMIRAHLQVLDAFVRRSARLGWRDRTRIRRARGRAYAMAAWDASKRDRRLALRYYLNSIRRWPWAPITYKAMLGCVLEHIADPGPELIGTPRPLTGDERKVALRAGGAP